MAVFFSLNNSFRLFDCNKTLYLCSPDSGSGYAGRRGGVLIEAEDKWEYFK